MDIEAVLLTGGASRRMGADKASLLIDGKPLAVRIAAELHQVCAPVTVLGRSPVAGCGFYPDADQFAGPLVALGRFTPSQPWVFVCSCDLPGFESSVVTYLASLRKGFQAILPLVDGRPQSLCGLYRSDSFEAAHQLTEAGERRVGAWLERLSVVKVDESHLPNPRSVRGVNSEEELQQAMAQSGDAV